MKQAAMIQSLTQVKGGEAVASSSDLTTLVPGLPNASCLVQGIATAGQPRAEHLRRLADLGYKVVIDLRHPDEPRGFDEVAAVRETGLRYENIPVTPPTLGDEEFERFRAVLRDPANRPALVHCGSANRVGALLIPYLILDEGRLFEEALRLAQQVGLRSAELAAAALDYVRRLRNTHG
jgi:uncharacterized protein (TIGR01244 family)